MTNVSEKIDIAKVVRDCNRIANEYIRNWQPVDDSWPTIEGSAYLRLSSDDQVRVEKGSLEQQVFLAIREAEARSNHRRRNYRITKFYIEPGISGRKENRPQFITLKKAIRRGEHKFVAFKELSRIARDSKIWKEFFQLCIESGCEIVIRGLPIDPNDPAQILQLDILAAFAEYEASQTSKRIRESVFSAMLSSGKFNSTHKVLGLDQMIVDGRPQVGFYKPNQQELNTVVWIMETFVKYGSYQMTLSACAEKGILNKTKRPFTVNSLTKLLTNPRYIGKWYLNSENRDIDPQELPLERQFHEIDLPLGPVVDERLWEKVQTTIKARAKNTGKSTRLLRVYPLTGLLKYEDGSSFRGCCGTGKTQRSYYYRNDKNNIVMKVDAIERNTMAMVALLIKDTPELQTAIKRAGKQTRDNIQFLEDQIKSLKLRLDEIGDEKQKMICRLDLLLTPDSTTDEVRSIRKEFNENLYNCNQRRHEVQVHIEAMESELNNAKETNFSWKRVAAHSKKVQEIMRNNDPVALRNAYHALFEEIRVGPENEKGVRTISYILKNEENPPEDRRVCYSSSVVEMAGVEPASKYVMGWALHA